MKIKYILILIVGLLSACATATIPTDNAPTSRGNLNSSGLNLGDVWLYDTKSGKMNYLKNIVDEGVQTNTKNKGNYSAAISDKTGIEYFQVLPSNKPLVEAAIKNSLKFTMSNYKQFGFNYPMGALNRPETADFRLEMSEYSSEQFKFLVVYEVIQAEKIEVKWNDDDFGESGITLNAPGQKVKVNFSRKSSFTCEGEENTCIVKGQVWDLRKTPGGATGYRFYLDTGADAELMIKNDL